MPATMATRWTRRPTEVLFRIGADSWAGQDRDGPLGGQALTRRQKLSRWRRFWHTAAARQIVLKATPGAPADYGAMTAAAAALGPGQVAVELAGDVAL